MFKEGCITNLDFDFIFHTVVVDGKRIKLQLWDYKKGEERFRRFPFSDYRLSHGLFIVYDITNVESFNDLKIWLSEITKHGGENVNKLLVGNKSDLDSKRAITFEQGQEFAKSMGMEYIETSAKNATNVDEAFTILITQIKERMKSEHVSEESRGVRLTAASGGKGKNHCVCC
eukprot:CAMPEP_0173145774 /NCGR_PEP_ID=MMETSP1105-20130129/8088_1 /TAXON_ID=2985 /ORGANISM="Ochromonas sp., Strain BG-1" /LENGTH=172 /DNA_ID=CAMNT_0014059829 /DNA_START=95 /DNA_END=613 /DNA_ORIENTATION=+